MRRIVLPLLLFLAAGCETATPFTVPVNKNVIDQGTIAPASLEAAARLDRVGRQIISTNPFLASAPAFGFVGTKVPELYHQNAEAIFCSEGLIAKCHSDDELAAVLCVELARITAESRNLVRLGMAEPDTTLPGPKPEPDPDQADLGDAKVVGTAGDPVKRLATLPRTDVNALAAEWHKNAGYRPASFAQAEMLLGLTEANAATGKQLGGTGAAPRWTK